ncbi:MAG: response regulator [Dissulfurispiraceae bacterium]
MKRVLIIDDDEQTRSALRHMLESLNCEVYEAADGQEGIDSFRKNPTDIVVTDIYLPGDNGLQVIMVLEREFPGIKIVAISGVETDYIDNLQAAKDFGAAHCIRKPVSFEDIRGILE